MRRLLAWIEGQPARGVLVSCLLAVVLIGIVDLLSGPQFFLTVIYLIPVSLAAWRTDWRRAVLVALLSISALTLADIRDPLEDVSLGALLWNQSARLAVSLFIVLLVTNLRDARQQAELMARTDVLTGVANLFSFREISARELERSRRTGQPLTLLFLDIDDFKIVNDYHGHLTGDEMLRRIARALCYAARRDDIVARVGGDEFVVLMPRSDAAQANQVVERVTSRLATISRPDGSPLTCSIGMATHHPATETIDEILQEADRAMYAAKSRRASDRRPPADRVAAPLRLISPPASDAVDASAFGMDS